MTNIVRALQPHQYIYCYKSLINCRISIYNDHASSYYWYADHALNAVTCLADVCGTFKCENASICEKVA